MLKSISRKFSSQLDVNADVEAVIKELLTQETIEHEYEVIDIEMDHGNNEAYYCILSEQLKSIGDKRVIAAVVPVNFNNNTGALIGEVFHQDTNPLLVNLSHEHYARLSMAITPAESTWFKRIEDIKNNGISLVFGDVYYFPEGICYGFDKGPANKKTHFISVNKSRSTKTNTLLDKFDENMPLKKHHFHQAIKLDVANHTDSAQSIYSLSNDLMALEHSPALVKVVDAVSTKPKTGGSGCLTYICEQATGKPLVKTTLMALKKQLVDFSNSVNKHVRITQLDNTAVVPEDDNNWTQDMLALLKRKSTSHLSLSYLTHRPTTNESLTQSKATKTYGAFKRIHPLTHVECQVLVDDDMKDFLVKASTTKGRAMLMQVIASFDSYQQSLLACSDDNASKKDSSPISWPANIHTLTQEQLLALHLSDDDEIVLQAHEKAIMTAIANGVYVDDHIINQYPLSQKPYQMTPKQFIERYPEVVFKFIAQEIDALTARGKTLLATLNKTKQAGEDITLIAQSMLTLKNQITTMEKIEITSNNTILLPKVARHIERLLPQNTHEGKLTDEVVQTPDDNGIDESESMTDSNNPPAHIPPFAFNF